MSEGLRRLSLVRRIGRGGSGCLFRPVSDQLDPNESNDPATVMCSRISHSVGSQWTDAMNAEAPDVL
jgi:hypothetical protein